MHDNTEQHRIRSRAWVAANPARVRATRRQWHAVNREHSAATARAWMAAHPERAASNARTQGQRRRARIAQVLATLTPQEWEAILDAAGRSCIYCGSQTRLTQDHLTPISRGGDHTAENVAPACLPCNQSKGAKVVAECLAEKAES